MVGVKKLQLKLSSGGKKKTSGKYAAINKKSSRAVTSRAGKFEHIGRSSSSKAIPFAFIRGRLSVAQLAELQKICREEFRVMQSDNFGVLREGIGRRIGAAFRASEKVPKMRANGAVFEKLAPAGLRKFGEHLTKKNPSLCAAIHKIRALTHTHGKKEIPVIPAGLPVKEALFSLIGIAQWTDGLASDPWHVDGGPSTVFFNATVRGERILEVEDYRGRSKKIHMRPGDWYIASPSCFWHRVLPVKGARVPSESLILRSAMLPKRLSGGRAKANGKRSAGFVYGTKGVFEKVAAAVTKELTTNGFHV